MNPRLGYLAVEGWLLVRLGLRAWLLVHGVCLALFGLMLVASAHDPEREWAELNDRRS